MRQLVVERISQSGPFQHTLTLSQRWIHFACISFEDVLADELSPVRSVLNLVLKQVTHFSPL